MKIEYWPEVDMLHIDLGSNPEEYDGGQDAGDPDIVTHFDKYDRLVALEISNASKRINLDRLRRSPIFVEVDPEQDAARQKAI